MKLYDLGKPSSPNRAYTLEVTLHKNHVDALPNVENIKEGTSVRLEGIGRVTKNVKVTVDKDDEGVDKQQTIVILLEALAVEDESGELAFKEDLPNDDIMGAWEQRTH
jgi:hypothetical protein